MPDPLFLLIILYTTTLLLKDVSHLFSSYWAAYENQSKWMRMAKKMEALAHGLMALEEEARGSIFSSFGAALETHRKWNNLQIK